MSPVDSPVEYLAAKNRKSPVSKTARGSRAKVSAAGSMGYRLASKKLG